MFKPRYEYPVGVRTEPRPVTQEIPHKVVNIALSWEDVEHALLVYYVRAHPELVGADPKTMQVKMSKMYRDDLDNGDEMIGYHVEAAVPLPPETKVSEDTYWISQRMIPGEGSQIRYVGHGVHFINMEVGMAWVDVYHPDEAQQAHSAWNNPDSIRDIAGLNGDGTPIYLEKR